MNFSNMEPDPLPTADDIRGMEQRVKDGVGKPVTLQPKVEYLAHPDVKAQLDRLAEKRDHAADVLGKPLLALTYQMEIDKILGHTIAPVL